MMSEQIRRITSQDTRELVELSRQLGYNLTEAVMRDQINRIENDPTHWMYAAIENDHIIGYIHGFLAYRITSPAFLEIAALVVHQDFRGRGIGANLVTRLESEAPVNTIRVRCNVKRELAHRFYNRLNFREIKEQKVFEKTIGTP